MELDPKGSYLMPVSFPQRALKAGVFQDVLFMSTSYLSNKDALAALLPLPFEPADEPVVTVYYQQCPKVNFLAGRGYNLIGVNLAAFFNGKENQLHGGFSLVLWENQINPILRGRELLGIPKLLAEIPDPSHNGDHWRAYGAENDRMLLDLEINGAQRSSDEYVSQQNAAQELWMGWRYIPNMDGVGAALSQPTLIGRETHFSEIRLGEGSVHYGDLTWESNPSTVDIVEALKTLVVREYVSASVSWGTMTITRSLNRVLA